MNMFDDYVRSLFHYYLNFYSAFSPERGRKQGELESIIYSDLSRCGAAESIHEVKGGIDRELARIPAFARRTDDRIWLDFRQTGGMPAQAESENWEARIRSSKFSQRVSTAKIDKLIKRAKKVRTTVEEHLTAQDAPRFLNSYGLELFACLDQVLANNRPECIDPNVYRKLVAKGTREYIRQFALKNDDVSLLAVYDACTDIDEFMAAFLG